jgi:UDP-2,3-diacylglucosamine hydrolase
LNAPKSAETVLHFLSDLHLSPDTPGITRLFLDYLTGEAHTAEQIFILGDLFDVWPGDDVIDDPEDGFSREIVDALRRLADSETGIAVLHGNRDFLLGKRFVETSGVRLLPDPYILSLPSEQFVLSHGDALCTDDIDYQSFRAQVRAPVWREALLARPLKERKLIAVSMRQQSEAYKHEKTRQTINLDINAAATDDFLRQHGYATMIHGHTHHPDRHEHLVDGIHVERWVLADWREDRGEYLAWDGQRFSRHALVPAVC